MGSLFPMLLGNNPFATEFSPAVSLMQFLMHSLLSAFPLSVGRMAHTVRKSEALPLFVFIVVLFLIEHRDILIYTILCYKF